MKINDIVSCLEAKVPLSLQEHYDNSGLLIGDKNASLSAALLTIDVTSEVLNEAIAIGAGLIISHHPLIFSGLKKLSGNSETEQIVTKAIKKDIAIYAAHTNFDNSTGGVNSKIAEKLGLKECSILKPGKSNLKKLVCFVPSEHIEQVRIAVFNAGAGHIGNYDHCSYGSMGEGTFRALDGCSPFVGEMYKDHAEKEIRFETIFPDHLQPNIVTSLVEAHPYEEVAYDIYPLDSENKQFGAGMIGELENEMYENEFLLLLKQKFQAHGIRYSGSRNKKIRKVAVCGGAGIFLLKHAIQLQADVFVTGDVKYHEFLSANNQILVIDIGHYESEQFTKEIFFDILNKKFPKFALHFSKINTNPINYLYS